MLHDDMKVGGQDMHDHMGCKFTRIGRSNQKEQTIVTGDIAYWACRIRLWLIEYWWLGP